ncbi:MAG: CBS domain-containing protein [Anaerolineales bacterium]
MQLILTHEQADFDALASLLGAYLLNESSIPVMPRKLNRNVRSFLTLYGFNLPFMEPQDLPAEKVESVILVDTQSMVTIKGMDKDTDVTVIDHHPLRDNLAEDWEIIIVDTGSVTTYLVELLSERTQSLSILYATLLLLGIYEDTGSLSYKNTTGRDGRSAAYLIDQGADLEMASNFLNPPLSAEQMKFFDLLSTNAKIQEINGHRILLTSGEMEDFNEEISTLAHKLRDFYDPDALFVVVSTREGVRLVARSTSDNIDVGKIAGLFGGGGHDRAAAALIRKDELKEQADPCGDFLQKLVNILPDYIKPSVTVGQIMSVQPHVLSPDTSVTEASKLMQQYGYEGYPVIEDGKVVGLLTRKVVDKAVGHHLKIKVGSLMDANEYSIHADDSIQQLQTLMTESGWGQIPVSDPVSGKMIGIVTRTDLLKTLTPKSESRKRRNLEKQLVDAFSPSYRNIIHAIAEEAQAIKVPIYVVGGFVRDLLLGRPSMDFDVVVEGDGIKIANLVSEKYGGRVTIHKRFGTAKWFLAGSAFTGGDFPEFLDFITARMEFYSRPTALPTVERSSIKFDLHRRDFTINTLAIRLDGKHFGELYDFWGGLNDLKNQDIRVLHSLSFIDDPTRILRAIRFEQRFHFHLEERTLQLLMDARSMLNNISGDRIRHEIDLILLEENYSEMLSRLQELGILKEIHTSLIWNEEFSAEISQLIDQPIPENWIQSSKDDQIITDRNSLIYLLWFSTLPDDGLNSLCDRLKFPKVLRKILMDLKSVKKDLDALTDAKPSEVVSSLFGKSMTSLFVARLLGTKDQVEVLDEFVSNWRNIKAVTTGWDLQKRGIQPGPEYKKIIERLRSAWLDGEVKTLEEEKSLLDEISSSKEW